MKRRQRTRQAEIQGGDYSSPHSRHQENNKSSNHQQQHHHNKKHDKLAARQQQQNCYSSTARIIMGIIISIAVFVVMIALAPWSPLQQSWIATTSTTTAAALSSSQFLSLTAEAGAAAGDPKQIVKAGNERRSDGNGVVLIALPAAAAAPDRGRMPPPLPKSHDSSTGTHRKDHTRSIQTTKHYPIARASTSNSSGAKDVPMAPWNSFAAGRGHAIISHACASDIKEMAWGSTCEGIMPAATCLLHSMHEHAHGEHEHEHEHEREREQNKKKSPRTGAGEGLLRSRSIKKEFSKGCREVLYPCGNNNRQGKNTEACKQFKAFAPTFNEEEMRQLENILALIDVASRNGGVSLTYWMTAGTMMGTLAHHSIIPWDDDVDVYVKAEHLDQLIANLKSLGLETSWHAFGGVEKRTAKVWDPSLPRMRKKLKNTFPFVDIFPVDCTNGAECIEYNSEKKHSVPIEEIFPLKRRPLGRLSLPFPAKVRDITERRYGSNYKDKCVKGNYNHRTDIFRRNSGSKMNCSDLILPVPFVYQYGQHQHYDMNQEVVVERSTSPWPIDFSSLSVEHVINESGTRLSSVIFDDGNEIRRSYADGLFGVDGNIITYNLPILIGDQPKLVPFLYEERLAMIQNIAGRSAKELNEEVLPILNRVVICNDYPPSNITSPVLLLEQRRLGVGEWNAERGLNWDIFPSFYPNADIIILNEMDWGMARSGNKDNTKEMASSLQMNYAYGVEFLELTNGNAKEINMTTGEQNLIGYHGNVVLSKWPIVKSEVVRLHPLYDLLYEEKTSGLASGERRLGGRMALFAQVRTDKGDILVISIHAHSGSKHRLLKQDARTICNEIENKWNANNVTNVLLGGDIDKPIPETLVSECGFFDLKKTNSKQAGSNRLVPTWRVECPNGGPPKVARYPVRGDLILARGPMFNVNSNSTMTNTIYAYRKKQLQQTNAGAAVKQGQDAELYDCISDHAIITFDVEISA